MYSYPCSHPGNSLTMGYFEHPDIGDDVPFWFCACGAELPDGSYREEFLAWQRLTGPARFAAGL